MAIERTEGAALSDRLERQTTRRETVKRLGVLGLGGLALVAAAPAVAADDDDGGGGRKRRRRRRRRNRGDND